MSYQQIKDQLIYCCQPSYGNGSKLSHKQFWSKSVLPTSPYASVPSVFDDQGGSLLANSFNHHWKTALNMQLNGHHVTRFIMLHDDIVPEDGWLGILLDEFDRVRAEQVEQKQPICDLLSVVIPIKDARGLTSTAIDDPGDPWGVYRRLTVHETGTLPETFGAEDCIRVRLSKAPQGWDDKPISEGGCGPYYRPLLVNTGLWICDFTRPWRFSCYFNISDRMAFYVEDPYFVNGRVRYSEGQVIPAYLYEPGMKGSFVAQVMSEDWNFSRQIHLLGARVMATRKVKLNHLGEAPYNNQDFGWGVWEHDMSLEGKWDPVPLPDVPGWLTTAEGHALEELARDKVVLEIGSYCGKSTILMARTAKHVYAIDTFDGRGISSIQGQLVPQSLKCHDTLEQFKENIKKYGIEDKVTTIIADTTDINTAAKITRERKPEHKLMDVAFIDGAHDYKSIASDTNLARKFLKEDGLLVYHDYQRAADYDVARVVDSLLASGTYEKVARVSSVIAIRKKPTTSQIPIQSPIQSLIQSPVQLSQHCEEKKIEHNPVEMNYETGVTGESERSRDRDLVTMEGKV